MAYTGGVREVELDAADVRELLQKLEQRFPGSEAALTRSAIAIDGQIHQDAWLETLTPDAEVFFLLRLEGG